MTPPPAAAVASGSLQSPLVLTKFAQRLRPAWRQRWSDDQDPISWSALRLARQQEAALLLHMGYAHHAFMAEPLQRRRRGLVQYHPT